MLASAALRRASFWLAAAVLASAAPAPESIYRGDLVAYPGPWGFQIRGPAIILVTDEELEALSDPDKALNLSTGRAPRMASLRQICERARAAGQPTLTVAFDHFFRQYRPGQNKPRRLLPDSAEYIQRIAAIGRFAQDYGLGLDLSLLSPLEAGRTFARTGESGLWMHYRKGLRDPVTGAFSVELWRQVQWANNKGPVGLEDAGVRVFAFRESRVSGTPYRVVAPASIVELKDGIQVEPYEGLEARAGDYRAVRVRVHGRPASRPAQPGLNRVLVVQQYRTPEMDYFSPKALPFLTALVDQYAAAGVQLHALYSDEIHIQGDWAYFNHHDHGEFALRYVSAGLAREFAARYGAGYADFAKYLIYFVHGQEDAATDLSARQGIMHVFGVSPEEVRRTALFRTRYYHLLQDGVADLFIAAKRHAEARMGRHLRARAHATWAESPTIDYWDAGRQPRARQQYEYTSNFVWSNTVHQASTACQDYFKWGDFLTGNGNDHTEGGWLDRNYFALALACSTGILNQVPYSYAAHWGMPAEISRRRMALVNTFGASNGTPAFGMVQDLQHRDVDVLMLYPLDLVAVDERFGSWMTQYGYANYVTPAKLLERGRVNGDAIEMAGRRFTTLAALFEPFPPKSLLEMMREFAAAGGRLIWSGPPPVLTYEGEPALPLWQEIFGVRYQPGADEGLLAPGRRVRFEGALAKVPPQTILTDFLVDRIYPVEPLAGTQVTARAGSAIVGTRRGSAAFLGFRPRDDQSRSLGYETRTWFEILHALGAYQGADHPEYVSRTSPYLACRFPNGATAIAPHLREYEEDWPGGFARDPEADRQALERHPPPSEALRLRAFRVNGHTVDYDGTGAVTFRVQQGSLIAFAGHNCRRITVDGRQTVFADSDMPLVAWAPIPQVRRVPGGAVYQIQCQGAGVVRVPDAAMPRRLTIYAEGPRPGSRGEEVASRRENGSLILEITSALSGRWLYLVPE
ncbi:MAG: hypothetical protein ACE15B_04160 [Bryobacteraceae bacterium]